MDQYYITIQKELKKQRKTLVYVLHEIEKQKLMVHEEWYDTADMKRVFNFSESKLASLRKKNIIPFTTEFGHPLYPKSMINQILLDPIFYNMQRRDKDFDDKPIK